jgi:tRNA (guanine-N7-)-methyltransferase
MRNRWHSDFFRNKNPLIIELGCGKGEYTTGLAENNPDINYIGIDIKGARLWRGCKTTGEKGLTNVAFLRTHIDHLELMFGEEEVSGIWITFPDPQPKKVRKRLTSPLFIERYRKILKKDGVIHLKTDDEDLFTYTMQMIDSLGFTLLFATGDLYRSGLDEPASQILTFYETMWLEEGRTIRYLRFLIS